MLAGAGGRGLMTGPSDVLVSAAFANADGGTLLLGIEDGGE